MKKLLIASHGHLASGVKSVVKILLRDDSAITAVDCYVDESDPNEKIGSWIDSVNQDDEAIIFTDLLGGSVCNTVTMLEPEKKGIVHVTGFNLAAVLEILISEDELTAEYVDSVLASASTLMQRVVVEEKPDEADDDFFA